MMKHMFQFIQNISDCKFYYCENKEDVDDEIMFKQKSKYFKKYLSY